jgi:uncharacterized alkaline shock family protein YloU
MTAPAFTAPAATPVGTAAAVRPEDRGRTEIAERVLERIAAKVVSDAEHAGGTARRMLGVSLGQDGQDTAPQITAHIDGQLATIEVTMTVAYPAPVRQVARRVRNDVIARVTELTGISVRHVDIDITRLIWRTSEGRVQ